MLALQSAINRFFLLLGLGREKIREDRTQCPCCSQAWVLFKGLRAGPSLDPWLSDLEERSGLSGEMRSKLAAQEVLVCGCGQVCL